MVFRVGPTTDWVTTTAAVAPHCADINSSVNILVTSGSSNDNNNRVLWYSTYCSTSAAAAAAPL